MAPAEPVVSKKNRTGKTISAASTGAPYTQVELAVMIQRIVQSHSRPSRYAGDLALSKLSQSNGVQEIDAATTQTVLKSVMDDLQHRKAIQNHIQTGYITEQEISRIKYVLHCVCQEHEALRGNKGDDWTGWLQLGRSCMLHQLLIWASHLYFGHQGTMLPRAIMQMDILLVPFAGQTLRAFRDTVAGEQTDQLAKLLACDLSLQGAQEDVNAIIQAAYKQQTPSMLLGLDFTRDIHDIQTLTILETVVKMKLRLELIYASIIAAYQHIDKLLVSEDRTQIHGSHNLNFDQELRLIAHLGLRATKCAQELLIEGVSTSLKSGHPKQHGYDNFDAMNTEPIYPSTLVSNSWNHFQTNEAILSQLLTVLSVLSKAATLGSLRAFSTGDGFLDSVIRESSPNPTIDILLVLVTAWAQRYETCVALKDVSPKIDEITSLDGFKAWLETFCDESVILLEPGPNASRKTGGTELMDYLEDMAAVGHEEAERLVAILEPKSKL